MIEREISEGLENLLRDESVVGEVQPPSEVKPIWERIAEIGTQVPEEDWVEVPRDLAKNLDRYLYKAPRDDL
jgi:hypothetical protein